MRKFFLIGLLLLFVGTAHTQQSFQFTGTGSSGSTPTSDATFDAGDGTVSGANETKPAFWYDDDADFGVAIGTDSLGVPFMLPVCGGVMNDCDRYVTVNSGFKAGYTDEAGNVEFEYDPDVGITKLVPGAQAQG